jgi:hypothetical protein
MARLTQIVVDPIATPAGFVSGHGLGRAQRPQNIPGFMGCGKMPKQTVLQGHDFKAASMLMYRGL